MKEPASRATVRLLSLFGAALLLRILFLGRDQFWMDEAYSALVSAWPAGKLIGEIPRIGSPPLYNFFLHVWIPLFGDSEWSLRLPSAIAGAALAPLLYVVGQRWFSKQVGMLAALTAMVSGIHLFYSQQARVYSLVVFFSLLSAHWLFCYFQEQKPRFLWGYAATLAILLYLHNWGIFFIPVPYVFILLNRRLFRFFPRILLAHFAVFLCYLPFLPYLFTQAQSGSSSWIPYVWEKLRPELIFFKTFEIFFAGGEYFAFKMIPLLRMVGIVLLIVVFVAALRPSQSAQERGSFIFFTVYLVVPILIPYLYSFYRPFYVCGRYDMIVFPAFCLLLAVGFTKLRRSLFYPAIGLYFCLALLNLAAYFFIHPLRDENRQMAKLLEEKGKAGDLVLFTGMSRLPIEYYLQDRFRQFSAKGFPAEAETTLGYFDYPSYLNRKNTLPAEAFKMVGSCTNQDAAPRRIWVVSTRWLNLVYGKEADFLNEPLYEALFAHCRLVRIHPFRKAFILEMQPT